MHMGILDHLDKLRIFVAVAEKGSINGATRELALTQPAITRAIQTLEQAAGIPLFTRDRTGMHLTDGGQLLRDTARKVLVEMVDVCARAARVQEEMSGRLMVGTYESLAEYLWPAFLLEMQKKFPHLTLSLKTNSQAGHRQELTDGSLDLLVDAEARPQLGLTLWPLYSDRFSFFARSARSISPESVAELSLLFVRGVYDEDNVTLEQHLAGAGYRFAREYTFDSFTTVRRMAAGGLGVALLPRRLARGDRQLHLVRAEGMRESFAPHRIFATVSPRRENDSRVKALVGLLRKHLAGRDRA